MTNKQKLFVDEYLIDFNATRAYKVVYKGCKKDETARVNGSKLLTNTNVNDYIQQRMKDREQRTEITQDKVLNELAKIAFSNATDFVRVIEKEYVQPVLDSEGNITDYKTTKYKSIDITLTEELSEESKAAIAEIKEGKSGIGVKQHDKVKALELIGKHLGMFIDKTEIDIKTLPKIILKPSEN